ncbi:MAG: MFS transporter [Anaerolineae bacterium]|nr:MFS transporter [Anaerolineae bacterium]
MRRYRLFTIFIIVFMDMLGFGLILPLLPYYAESYGAAPAVVGLLVASYAAAQLVGAPFLGRLSDRYGRRPILLFSEAGSVAGFLLMGFADPLGRMFASLAAPQAENLFVIGVLFFSRVVDGLTGGNITVAQAYIADITDEQNRAKSLGLIGAAFGLGFIIGPAAGGTLSRWGYNFPAFVAAAVFFANWLSIFFFLPESLAGEQKEKALRRQRAPFTLQALLHALNRPKVGPLLHIRLFYGLAFATFQTIFSLYAQGIGLNAQTTGYVLAYVGVLSVVVQGGLIGMLTRRFRDNWLITAGLWLMAFSLLVWGFTTKLWLLLIILLPLSLAGGVLNTILQSAISKSVPPEEMGGILGISASLEAISRVVAPSIGGYLIQNLGLWSPGVFSAALMFWVVGFTYRHIVLPARRERLMLEGQGAP